MTEKFQVLDERLVFRLPFGYVCIMVWFFVMKDRGHRPFNNPVFSKPRNAFEGAGIVRKCVIKKGN